MDQLPQEIVIEILKRCTIPKINLLLVCKQWTNLCLRYVCQPWIDIKGISGLDWACVEGYCDYYIEWSVVAGTRWDPSISYNNCIRAAAANGHAELVRVLLQDNRVNPNDWTGDALGSACQGGYIDVVKVLLADRRIKPHTWDNHALQMAVSGDYIEIVKLLMDLIKTNPKINPASHGNQALEIAMCNNNKEMVDLLLTDERVQAYCKKWGYPKGIVAFPIPVDRSVYFSNLKN
jgi:hypothetical protein